MLKDSFNIVLEQGLLKVANVVTDNITASLGTFTKIKTQELCVDDVCVTKEQFQAVFGGSQMTKANDETQMTNETQSPNDQITNTEVSNTASSSDQTLEEPTPTPESTPEVTPEVTPEPEGQSETSTEEATLTSGSPEPTPEPTTSPTTTPEPTPTE